MIFSNDGRVSIASTSPQSITSPVNCPIESFNMPVISVPQEAQRERCSPLQYGALWPTALSITLTEASVLSVPLWHPPQSTERMMNAPSTLTSQSEHTCSPSLSWTLFVLLSFTLSFSHFKHDSFPLSRSLSFSMKCPLFSPTSRLLSFPLFTTAKISFGWKTNSVTNPGSDIDRIIPF